MKHETAQIRDSFVSSEPTMHKKSGDSVISVTPTVIFQTKNERKELTIPEIAQESINKLFLQSKVSSKR